MLVSSFCQGALPLSLPHGHHGSLDLQGSQLVQVQRLREKPGCLARALAKFSMNLASTEASKASLSDLPSVCVCVWGLPGSVLRASNRA